MCVLMLRGPQTPGELKQRTERMHPFAELADVHETLERLIERELVARLERRPGHKEERYAQLLQGEDDAPGLAYESTAEAPPRGFAPASAAHGGEHGASAARRPRRRGHAARARAAARARRAPRARGRASCAPRCAILHRSCSQ